MTHEKVESIKKNVLSFCRELFVRQFGEDGEKLGRTFETQYTALLDRYEDDYVSEVEGLRRLITAFRPALMKVLQPCEEFDLFMNWGLQMFKATWEGAHRRRKKPSPKREGPIMPGSDDSFEIKFYCTLCGQELDIPAEKKAMILAGTEDIEIPRHHDEEMKIRISKIDKEKPVEDVLDEDDDFVPAELLMGHVPAEDVEYLKVMSVGIDVGSTTSHLIFSRLTLKRETSFFNMSSRFNLVDRDIVYESSIIFTPLIDRNTIDIEAVLEFCEEEYRKAGITQDMVDTGAVIVTGETAKKENAAEIVRRLSSESGKFVSATAGPNLESLLGAMGSGIVETSRVTQKTILHTDIGGGTSNLALVSNGHVLCTACINIGGRLLGIDENLKIWRIDGPAQFLMNYLGMDYSIGDIISEDDVKTISREYAKTLLEVILGKAESPIAKDLMMTENLDFSVPVDAYSFSGGIGELVYGSNETFDDIGRYLADEIQTLIKQHDLSVVEPDNKIRATVIGAGAFSLSVSGSTTFTGKCVQFPITNIPVLPVYLRREEFDLGWFEKEVNRTFQNFDMVEGEDTVALYFREPVYHSNRFAVFARAIEKVLSNSAEKEKTIILVFAYDFAKVLGVTMRRETSIYNHVLCLDELQLEAGDWIDIGAPLKDTESFPVTVKSLVFNQNKEYRGD